jgi:hypothetical protein
MSGGDFYDVKFRMKDDSKIEWIEQISVFGKVQSKKRYFEMIAEQFNRLEYNKQIANPDYKPQLRELVSFKKIKEQTKTEWWRAGQ